MNIVAANGLGHILSAGKGAVANYASDLGRLSSSDQAGYRPVRNSQDRDRFVVSARTDVSNCAEDIPRFQESGRDDGPAAFPVTSEVNSENVITGMDG